MEIWWINQITQQMAIHPLERVSFLHETTISIYIDMVPGATMASMEMCF